MVMDAVVYFHYTLVHRREQEHYTNSQEIIDKIIKIPNCHLEKI